MRRLGDFLRWRMAVDTSFFAPEPEGAAAASSAMSRRFAVERARSSDVVGKDTLSEVKVSFPRPGTDISERAFDELTNPAPEYTNRPAGDA
jgi:hypothetical protein